MPRPDPHVTIGVPAYNASAHLSVCLDSLLAQVYGDFVLQIADNASTDETEEICRKYVAMDPRVRYHRHPRNIGMYPNMNFLLRTASTPYVKLANADDYWAPGMLTDALRVMESNPDVVLAYPMMTLVDESGAPFQAYGHRLHLVEPDPTIRFKRALSEIGLVSQLMGVMRASTVRRMRPMRSLPGEDILFVCELSLYGKLFQTSEHQYFRRFHPQSSSFKRTSMEHQVRHVLEEGATAVRYLTWRQHVGFMSRIIGSPLSIPGKVELLGHIGRRMVWNRVALGHELLHRG